MKKHLLISLWVLVVFACNQKHLSESKLKQQGLPYYSGPDFTPEWYAQDQVPDSIHCISSFSFTDQNGNTITEKEVFKKIYVADFFFTACAGICPRLTANLKMVQEVFKNDSNVVLLSHSVMPGKDVPAVLKRYAINNGIIDDKWFLLTANKDSLYTIARRSYFADEDIEMKKDTSDFLHTENVLLIDSKRRIRGIYKGIYPSEMQLLIRDIKLLQSEGTK